MQPQERGACPSVGAKLRCPSQSQHPQGLPVDFSQLCETHDGKLPCQESIFPAFRRRRCCLFAWLPLLARVIPHPALGRPNNEKMARERKAECDATKREIVTVAARARGGGALWNGVQRRPRRLCFLLFHFLLTSCCSFPLPSSPLHSTSRKRCRQPGSEKLFPEEEAASTHARKVFREKWKVGICVCTLGSGRGRTEEGDINQEASSELGRRPDLSSYSSGAGRWLL